MVTKGRLELLQWLNDCTQSDYNKIEQCSDAIGFCHVIDALHPSVIQLTKLNLCPRYPEDFQKNLRILNEALIKLKIKEVFPFDKMAKGKFQDNMMFLQWLYGYARKMGPQQLGYYKGYAKRIQILDKQKKDVRDMSPHLIPNAAFFPDRNQYQQQGPQDYEDYQMEQNDFQYEGQQQRLNQIGEYIKDLQVDLKGSMEKNWKIMHAIESVLQQRNRLNQYLNEIERTISKFQKSQIKDRIMDILTEVPDDFKPQ